jgi:hypothetical protein
MPVKLYRVAMLLEGDILSYLGSVTKGLRASQERFDLERCLFMY